MPALSQQASQCRYCTSGNVFTVDSRPAHRPGWRRRRKQCNDCDKRWSTVELPIEDIEAILAITYKLDDLSVFAKGVHEMIEQLKSVHTTAVDEANGVMKDSVAMVPL